MVFSMSSGKDFPLMRENGTWRKPPPPSDSAEGARCCCLGRRWEELRGVPGADRGCTGGCKLNTLLGDGKSNQKNKSTSSKSSDRHPQCLELSLSSVEAESTKIEEKILLRKMRERVEPLKKEIKGEVSSQGCNISALTARLEDAWRP